MIEIEVNEGRLPWIVGIGTILFGILLAALSKLYPDDSNDVMKFSYLIIALIIASGIWFCLDGRNRKLTVKGKELCYTNWFGRKKTFLLEEIACCHVALEADRGNKNYLKIYDLHNLILCKLEFNMKDSFLFLQYLLDNHVKVEYTENSDILLKGMLSAVEISPAEIAEKVNGAYKEAKSMILKWAEENKSFGAEWKIGIATYLEKEIDSKKQLWQQKGYDATLCVYSKDEPQTLPEGYYIIIEGYLQKDGEFVIDKRNEPVTIFTELLYVSKTMRIGEIQKISFYTKALEYLHEQLSYYENILPGNRYHTEQLTLNHELKEKIKY